MPQTTRPGLGIIVCCWDRLVVEGVTKTAPYVERLLYFRAKPGDRQTVAKLTRNASKSLDNLGTGLVKVYDEWSADNERVIIGLTVQLEMLIQEVRYRGAWIRMYRGMVLPADSDERKMLLNQSISDVSEFADAGDNDSGVKFDSLLLKGMCARMLGEWDNAADFLKRAADKDAAVNVRTRAYFEMAVCLMDRRQYDEASKAIDNFVAQSDASSADKVAVDLQAMLLRNHLLELRAEDVKQENPAESAKLLEESRKILMDFIEKYPAYRDQVIEIVAGKYEGTDTENLPPEIAVLVGTRAFTNAMLKAENEKKKIPDFTGAEKIFTGVLKDEHSGKSAVATALWFMGHIRNTQRKNDQAADYFVQLAEKFPTDSRARDAALSAVLSLRGVMTEKKATAAQMGLEFVKKYAHCLEVLVKNWGGRENPGIRSYNYELGMMYDILDRNDEALSAFRQVDPDSDLALPAQSRILSLRAEKLFDSAESPGEKQRLAVDLIRDLETYCRRAREFAGRTPDADRKKQVLGWGADCDIVVAQVLKDVMNQIPKSIERAERIPQTWPEVPNIARRSQEFIIRSLLESGQTTDAVEKLLKLVEKDPNGVEGLIAQAIEQIYARILRLEFLSDDESRRKLSELRKAYRIFAEKLHAWARQRNIPADKMYGFEQAVAIAYSSSEDIEEVKKAQALFEQLNAEKANQTTNVLGMARCLRRLGKNVEAMAQYTKLVDGLPSESAQWWRAQLERLKFALEICGDDKDALENIRLQIRVLGNRDDKMGEYAGLFNAVDRRADKMLKNIGKKTGG